jgi:hypothetical protein
MIFQREWATPLTIGTFLLSAVTGIAIFFHIDTGLAKWSHEWLSWLLVGAAVLHVVANFGGFMRYFFEAKGLILMGIFTVLLVLSFVPLGGARSQPPFVAPIRALSQAPLPVLAQVAKITPEELRARLAKAKLPAPTSDQQTLADLAGPNVRKQAHILSDVISGKK